MSKFLYFQDGHYQGKNSRNRLDNYPKDFLIKLDEMISIAKQNKCEAILDGGDIFESHSPSYNILDAVCDKIENAKIDIYSLLGNHCMLGGHLETSQSTGLMHLMKRSKHFHLLTEINERHFNDLSPFAICGIDYYYGVEEDLKNKYSIQTHTYKNTKRWTIYIIHALITPSKFFDNVPHVQCKDIKTNVPLILCSHYHTPFKKEINNTTFLNIGCFGRLNINEAKINPSVLLIDTDKQSYEVIKLKSAKKAEEIFDLSKYKELKENEKSIEDFIASLNSATWQISDLNSQIEIIAKEQNIDKEVIEYIKTKIKEIKE
jgi:DNA repair exonuclease SbcCD nuclease subunit